jgi:hypothetical protein
MHQNGVKSAFGEIMAANGVAWREIMAVSKWLA